jgi:hypothetical protein
MVVLYFVFKNWHAVVDRGYVQKYSFVTHSIRYNI